MMCDSFLTPGKVILAGAGSQAGLITVKALQAVREADVIVYDDLMDQKLLSEAGEGCELIPVGKRKDNHKREQDEIEQLLIGLAKEGKRVVRLKGGDPTVFGRGGEEALALEAAGIPYELIPGVSSCIAAPEHMGISITKRGMASSFTVVTGHGDEKTAEEYETLAGLKGTLVYLMGLSRAAQIAEGLLSAGKDPETPVSILSCIFMEGEKRYDGRLKDLGAIAAGAQPPAIIVIGDTAGMHLQQTRAGSNDRPSALVVGTHSFTQRMVQALRSEGIRATPFACVGITPLAEEIPDRLEEYDWMVFTSANGVRVFLAEMDARRTDLRSLSHLKIACIGRGTAGELEKARLYAELIPERFTSESLAESLATAVKPGEKVLILRAAEGSPLLTARLEEKCIAYRDCRIYSARYVQPEPHENEEAGHDFVIFASAGGVRCFLEHAPYPANAVPVCIGDITAAELESRTGIRAIIARESSVEGILQALTHYAAENLIRSGDDHLSAQRLQI